MDPKKDQPEVKPESVETKKPTFDDYFDNANIEFVESLKKDKEPEKKVEAKPIEEPPCPSCQKDKDGKTIRPYKILKWNGQDRPVYSEKELDDLAQMGFDYTQKTQALSAKDKELESKADQLLKRLEAQRGPENKDELAFTPRPGMSAGDTVIEPNDEEINTTFGLDQFAEEPIKKLAKRQLILERQLKQKDSTIFEMQKIQQALMLEKATVIIGGHITDSRKKYPFEDVVTEDGKNLTQDHILNTLALKFNATPQRSIPEMVEEVIRDYSLTQQKARASAVPEISNALSTAQFKEKYPDLYSKVVKEVGGKAVAEHIEATSELPPTIEGKTVGNEARSKSSKKDYKSLGDAIDDAFTDKDILSGFGG